MNRTIMINMLALAITTAFAFSGASGAAETTAGSTADASAKLSKIEEVKMRVAKDPKDRRGWIQLGNLHFDDGRQKEAVDAYQKALDLKGDDPDVLCDQGIMYDQLGEVVKAMENFDRALLVNPKHMQSLYHAGRVSNERLNQPSRTLHYWKRLVQVDPKNPNVQPIKSFIERFDKDIETLGGAIRKKEAPAPVGTAPATATK